MTPAICAAFCADYAYFGLEYGSQCYCGAYPRAGSGLVAEGDCKMTCAGDDGLYCGAGNRLTTYYSSDDSKIAADPAVQTVVGDWTYYNCMVDSPRALVSGRVSSSNTQSAASCLAAAETAGYAWAGLEYGRECWMGKGLTDTATNATDGGCSMVCSGDARGICGGSSRLTLYQLAGS
ncbi:WSC-domain-containing protein [Aulographum hederae CBS 113979]|uniref:WSC-domain-containing protein n=1 Tax=Aulographum hederae CBS 113979 TaxID=1176131 RepID=A0A6G1GYH8_9PEZI|nr:WSC-domain-containing protein [Aulographum hederae CBS 113979]